MTFTYQLDGTGWATATIIEDWPCIDLVDKRWVIV
jgi:hypothetical protein